MVGGVDLFHFYLSVHIAVIHKVHICCFHLGKKQIRNEMSGYFKINKTDLSYTHKMLFYLVLPFTSGMQFTSVTTLTMSSSGSRELHFSSV